MMNDWFESAWTARLRLRARSRVLTSAGWTRASRTARSGSRPSAISISLIQPVMSSRSTRLARPQALPLCYHAPAMAEERLRVTVVSDYI